MVVIPETAELRRAGNCRKTVARECMREIALKTPRSLKINRERVIQAPEQRFPCSLGWRPQWNSLCPWSPQKSGVEQISTYSLWRSPHWSMWVPEVDWPHGKFTLKQDSGRTCDSVRHSSWNRLFLNNCTLWKGLWALWSNLWATACRNGLCWRGSWRLFSRKGTPHWNKGMSVRIPPLRMKEQQRQCAMYWLQPHSTSPWGSEGEEVENSEVDLR